MNATILMTLFIIPALVGLLLLFVPSKIRGFHGSVSFLTAIAVLILTIGLWGKKIDLVIPWAGFGISFQLRFYAFSQFIVAAVAGFSVLIALYALKFMLNRVNTNQFFGFFLISEAMAVGAALANNLIVMLFFWEGLLITLFAMINLGHNRAYRTALKAFAIVGLSDLCLMLGIGIVGAQAGTLTMDEIHLSTIGLNGVAFVMMLIGAMAKAGAMPFHTWIPDAAVDAPLPFMAFLPAALEKLIGIYLVARISLDLFTMDATMKLVVMIIGAVTLILAVMMALIQQDYKRLLSYHAISQVGYMILGIGTGNPIGIAGGLFHMINHAIYKCCLFLTGGSVEKQIGTTDLHKLGGLARKMPWTFACFAIAAASISGVPPFNGFVSKELIFAGTQETGYPIFFIIAALGAVFTAASFLKLGHAVYFGKQTEETKKATESNWTMVLPMTVLAAFCLLFGLVFNLPLNLLIKPSVAGLSKVRFAYHIGPLFWVTVIILAVAVLNHIYGLKRTGRGSGASEHIHHAPLLHTIYDLAEQRVFDPYVQGRKVGGGVVKLLFLIDRVIDWVYQRFVPGVAYAIASIRRAHNGRFADYLAWAIGGLAIVIWVYLR
ncbi:MAG TPA: NADH-quinone oxidoreductase subunit L [Bacillota bacterium]|nr:NADH-quinone oxidoreductase subunit L [Bacillota bacterium]